MTDGNDFAPQSEFLRQAQARGFLKDCNDLEGLDQALIAAPVGAYVGYDCTADSLHVGHLFTIMLLRLFQRTGHRPVVLLGGGTTRIGDPSFRDESRPLLDDAAIARNKAGIRQAFTRLLEFGPEGAREVDNAEWLDRLLWIPLLRDVGVHISVNRMLKMDSVRTRLEREQPLSFLEFNYMVLQAYDFLELSRRHGVALQMGGSDQWSNILAGAELIRRIEGKPAFALTTPLLATASGQKMGKTAGGAVWLNPDRLGPYDYWQFWRNTEDADVGRFLKLFTDLPLPEIARLEALQGQEVNEAKKVLATEATALLHGRDAALAAAETARRTFEEGQAADTLPSRELPREDVFGRTVVDVAVSAGLAASKGEARRLIQQGGLYLNGTAVAVDTVVTEAIGQGAFTLSKGKKIHVRVSIAATTGNRGVDS